MKKWSIFIIAAAIIAFTGASPWEGAAAVAPEGELPASGFFVATNSFPRNTVVDITNLENDRTVRAIVANRLDSQGLLAIVSQEAADMIGMRSGSVSRLRMVRPADPIAAKRFNDGVASGTPVFDAGSKIADELYKEDTYMPPSDPEEPRFTHSGITGPSYVLEPEWRPKAAVVDLSRFNEKSEPRFDVNAEAARLNAEEAAKKEAERLAAEEEARKEAQRLADEEAAKKEAERLAAEEAAKKEAERLAAEEAAKKEAERLAAEEAARREAERLAAEEAARKEAQRLVAEEAAKKEAERLAAEEAAKKEAERLAAEEAARKEAQRLAAEEAAKKEAQRLAAEESARKEAQRLAAEEAARREAERLAAEEAARREAVVYNLVPAEERPPSFSLYGIDPNDLIPGITSSAQVTEPAKPVIEVTERDFSVPKINELARGQYYVQVAAFNSSDEVENALSEIDHRYRPVIYSNGDSWFRILLGPLNQGESAAILQRFKSIGFTDAFVRQGR